MALKYKILVFDKILNYSLRIKNELNFIKELQKQKEEPITPLNENCG